MSGVHAFAGLVEAWKAWPADPSPMEATMRDHGMLCVADDSWVGGPFPDWYHSTFHSPEYVVRHWARFLTVVGLFPRAALGFQDIVLLRRD